MTKYHSNKMRISRGLKYLVWIVPNELMTTDMKERAWRILSAKRVEGRLVLVFEEHRLNGVRFCMYNQTAQRAQYTIKGNKGLSHIPVFGATQAYEVEIDHKNRRVVVTMPTDEKLRKLRHRTGGAKKKEGLQAVSDTAAVQPMGLREAVATINRVKDEIADLDLEVTEDGRLRAIVIYE